MNVWLDDERPAPEGWILCRWPEQVIDLIKTGKVEWISLDYDLGEDSGYSNPRTGYDVITWLEEQVINHGMTSIPVIFLHDQNPISKKKMAEGILSIKREMFFNIMILKIIVSGNNGHLFEVEIFPNDVLVRDVDDRIVVCVKGDQSIINSLRLLTNNFGKNINISRMSASLEVSKILRDRCFN